MCKITDNIQKNLEFIVHESINTMRKNKELEEYNILATLSIEGTKDIIYASDIKTDEILFMNQNAINTFGDGIGGKCYEVFQNLGHNCDFCTNPIIAKQIGEPYNWVFYNENSNCLYYITDVAKEVNGRLIRFERATPLNGLTKEIVKLANEHKLV